MSQQQPANNFYKTSGDKEIGSGQNFGTAATMRFIEWYPCRIKNHQLKAGLVMVLGLQLINSGLQTYSRAKSLPLGSCY